MDPARSEGGAPAAHDPAAPIDLAEGEALAAVASLWRKTGRELRARFGGTSMEPALPPGAEVLLRCGETGGPGDVIAFLSGGRLVLHRVVARAGDGAWTLTRGDARVLPDVPILAPDAIVGRVAGAWREGVFDAVVAGPPDSLPRRCALGLARAVLDVSPWAGSVLLRSLHTAGRLARSVRIALRRSRPAS